MKPSALEELPLSSLVLFVVYLATRVLLIEDLKRPLLRGSGSGTTRSLIEEPSDEPHYAHYHGHPEDDHEQHSKGTKPAESHHVVPPPCSFSGMGQKLAPINAFEHHSDTSKEFSAGKTIGLIIGR